MTKKINAETAKTLKRLGVNAKNEEEAHKKLIEILEKEGIEGMEDESLDVLINMADGFINNDENEVADNDNADDDSDEEMDELADEVEDDEASNADEEETKDESLVDDEEDDEEDEKTTPKPKKAAPVKKVEDKKVKKTNDKKEKKQTTTTRGQKLDPKNNPEDREVLNNIEKIFGKDYSFDYLKSSGVTVKHIGKNGKRGAITIENLTKHHNGTITCNLYLLTMVKQTEVLDELSIDYNTNNWLKVPAMKNITLEEVEEIIKKVFETITNAVTKIDKRLGENRKKMEENLQKTEKKVAKKDKPVDDEEDDEEDEKTTPKPKKAKK